MSEKPIAEKLLIKEYYRVLFINEPEDYMKKLGKLPENVIVLTKLVEPVDFIQVFVTSKKDLEDQLLRLKPLLTPKGLLWVTYPKGTSKMKVDVNRDIIAQYTLSIGLKPVAMISVDETWSALRLKIA